MLQDITRDLAAQAVCALETVVFREARKRDPSIPPIPAHSQLTDLVASGRLSPAPEGQPGGQTWMLDGHPLLWISQIEASTCNRSFQRGQLECTVGFRWMALGGPKVAPADRSSGG